MSEAISPYLPSNAGQAVMTVGAHPDLLSPGAGAAVLLAWLVALVGAAVVLLRRRGRLSGGRAAGVYAIGRSIIVDAGRLPYARARPALTVL